MKIQVTAEDIAEAESLRGSGMRAFRCPVALAVNRRFGVGGVSVNHVTITVGTGREYDTPACVEPFLIAFDNGQAVSPFEFDLPIKGDV